MHVDQRLDLLIDPPRRDPDFTPAIVVSIIVHVILMYAFLRAYRPAAEVKKEGPIARYVELMKQNPQQFTESPGQKLDQAPSPSAPLSDGNRRASAPEATGDIPTTRPGDGSGAYTPPQGSRTPPMQAQPQVMQDAARPQQAMQPSRSDDGFRQPSPDSYSTPTQRAVQASAASVDWRDAIRQIGRSSSGGIQGADLGNAAGGEKGSADTGPLSFESQWYDWGDYAQSMVSKIRVNWYGNMPQLIRTGMKGVVTIRFTIHRDGQISDVTILESSGVPPYDYAAKKAIELSSPLAALPKDFPNSTERVTCMFYYNMDIPAGR